LLACFTARATEPVTVAVASNFSNVASELAARFAGETGVSVRLVPGSTGKLYAQVLSGAPFDIFLAADDKRPALLEEAGLIVEGSRFAYATGALVLWSRSHDDCDRALRDAAAGHVAIANPAVAPYGFAARQYLETKGLWAAVAPRLVYGENVMQAAQFVATGNAGLGFIARSLLATGRLPDATCSIDVPHEAHDAIRQDAVMLQRAADNVNAARFYAFLKSPAASAVIVANGFGETS
jgi:molybdate transport system substrate-binding protein